MQKHVDPPPYFTMNVNKHIDDIIPVEIIHFIILKTAN